MFTYIFDGVGCEIKTPGVSDFSQIKTERIEQTAGKVVIQSVYPNGLTLRVEQEAGRTVIFSNRPLAQNPDGSYTAPTA